MLVAKLYNYTPRPNSFLCFKPRSDTNHGMAHMRADGHYVDWDTVVDHNYDALVEGWEESDRGEDYVRFTDGTHVIHVCRVKLLTGVAWIVQMSDGPNDAEEIATCKDEAIARNNALAAMEKLTAVRNSR